MPKKMVINEHNKQIKKNESIDIITAAIKIKKENFLFKAFLEKEIYRVVEINGQSSLYDLAQLLIKSFGFDFDHAFGFFGIPDEHDKQYYDSGESYELFADLDNAQETMKMLERCPKSVKKTKIADVFTSTKKQLIFLFDYGQEWEFLVNCIDIQDTQKAKKSSGRIIRAMSKGKAPEQYAQC